MSKTITKDTLKIIGGYILEGLTEKEACMLAQVSHSDLQNVKENDTLVLEFIERKAVEFKRNHLKEIQSKKDPKVSMWMLEKLRADEFGVRARSAPQQTVNIINTIIKDIQNEDTGIVTYTREVKILEQRESESESSTSDFTVKLL